MNDDIAYQNVIDDERRKRRNAHARERRKERKAAPEPPAPVTKKAEALERLVLALAEIAIRSRDTSFCDRQMLIGLANDVRRLKDAL